MDKIEIKITNRFKQVKEITIDPHSLPNTEIYKEAQMYVDGLTKDFNPSVDDILIAYSRGAKWAKRTILERQIKDYEEN